MNLPTQMDSPLDAIDSRSATHSIATSPVVTQRAAHDKLVVDAEEADDTGNAASDEADKSAHGEDAHAQFAYSQPVYEQWQTFIEAQVGFILPNSQHNWLWQAINRLSRKAKLSPERLLNHVNHAKKDKGLIQEVIEAVLIPQSHFFRHQSTLDFILQHAQQVSLREKQNEGQDDYSTTTVTVANPSQVLGALLPKRFLEQIPKQLSKKLPKQLSTSLPKQLTKPLSAYLSKHAERTPYQHATSLIATSDAQRSDITPMPKESPIPLHHPSNAPVINSTGNDNVGNVKVWSVGCSFGQEAWSIAMTLEDAGLCYKIWGLDVNKSALEHAKKGRYELKQLDEIPQHYKKFVKLKEQYWDIVPVLQQHVEFLHYNLITLQLPDLPLVDVIVCQNVLIYFRHFEQRDILARLVKRLNAGGYIILAPGEASQWQHPDMRRPNNLQVNAWQKVP